MLASNKPRPATPASLEMLSPELRGALLGLHAGSLGRTVRCTPRRRTVRVDGDVVLYGKWRLGGCDAAAREWHWLHLLPLMGLRVPRPVAWLGCPARSVLVTEEVAGRPMDAWLVEAAADGWLDELAAYAVRHVAPAVRRLHDNGLVYRDLYWNHVYVSDPRGEGAPVFLDVERVFQPRWRRGRWIVKDLAGLLSSLPVAVPGRWQLRFLRAYAGGELDPRSIAAIRRKAERIRGHVPKYG